VTRARALLVLGSTVALLATVAHASPVSTGTAAAHIDRARVAHAKGDFLRARDELLAAFAQDPRPELLFALGQIEFNLRHYPDAIRYYERFLATNPHPDEVSLAQQAIGAARARLDEPTPLPPLLRPVPPPPPPHRAWDWDDTGLAALGGAAIALGAGLAITGHHLGTDHSGTLADYDDRTSRARSQQWIGAACLAAGALTVGGAFLRWRIHLVASASRTDAVAAIEGRW
jgi:tetratricopeptide (TPR) repeat protein